MSDPTATRTNQREHILDVALQLMSRAGSTGVSMRQLARACGLQVAAIYHYFPSKDALLTAVIEERRYSSRLVEDTFDVDPQGSVADRLRAVFRMFWTGALEEEPVLRLLLGEGLRSEPAALPTGAALLELFRTGVTMALEEHVPEVEDPKSVSEVYMSQVFSAFLRHVFDPGLEPAELGEDHADVVVRVVLGSPS